MSIGLDYACLGVSEEVRKRRYNVFVMTVKGAKPVDIQKQTGRSIRQVYNDLSYIRSHPMNNLSINMMKDIDQSWFNIKIYELEQNLMQLDPGTDIWLKTQDQIRKYKVELMKLSGVLVDKVEHSGDVGITLGWDEKNDDDHDSV